MDIGLLNMVDKCLVGHSAGVVHFLHVSLLIIDEIGNVGNGSDDIHIELAVEAFLDDFHVEQAEESTAESEAEGNGTFRLEC